MAIDAADDIAADACFFRHAALAFAICYMLLPRCAIDLMPLYASLLLRFLRHIFRC